MQLKSSYPEEFRILQSVVYGNREEVTEFGREAPDLIDHLIGYGLVEKNGEDFDIRFDAIRDALQNLFPRPEAEDRWAEISRRRNELEVTIRLAIYYDTRGIPAAEWAEVIDSTMTTSRRSALTTYEPGIIFSRKDSPLYLSDLLMIIKDERVLPYLGGRRSGVVSALNIVNALRKDAHARTVVDGEMIAVRAALDVLEENHGHDAPFEAGRQPRRGGLTPY